MNIKNDKIISEEGNFCNLFNRKPQNIGFVSTRLAGTDGVSLEASKWAKIFEKEGFTCFYFAGECDRPPERSYTEIISETGISTIAHHHDFFWERQAFMTNAVWEYLNMAFPPHSSQISHVVINSSAKNQLGTWTK